jgi:hypothetical protein
MAGLIQVCRVNMRTQKEILEDIETVKNWPGRESNGQNVYYGQPSGQNLKNLMLKDFELELLLFSKKD